MLTAVVHAGDEPMALVETLAALVPAVAEGLMSHAVVTTRTPSQEIERIADAMGATYVPQVADPWREGTAAARGDWVLLLHAGETPEPGWIAAVEGHLMRQSAGAAGSAFLPLAGGLPSLLERGAMLFGRLSPRPGLVAPRAAVAEGKALGSARRLAVRRRRLP